MILCFSRKLKILLYIFFLNFPKFEDTKKQNKAFADHKNEKRVNLLLQITVYNHLKVYLWQLMLKKICDLKICRLKFGKIMLVLIGLKFWIVCVFKPCISKQPDMRNQQNKITQN